MNALVSNDDRGRKLLDVHGVGLITTAYLLAWFGDAKQFKSGHDLATWTRLVPKQVSTGGKTRLLGIGKRSNSRLRCNLIHDARFHLSETQETAMNVGARYGKLVLLRINSKQMHEDGFEFFKTKNDVWLVECVPLKYLEK